MYDDGSASDGPVSRQYYLAFYWALMTVTAINPIPPSNDIERNYQLVVALVNRLFFAYVIGKITGLISNLDRQQTVVEDKMDLVKEYLRWQGIPRELAIRIKRYYEFFYAKDASHMDEESILSGLSPQLHAELMQTITERTLGRLPLFTQLCNRIRNIEISPRMQLTPLSLLLPYRYSRSQSLINARSLLSAFACSP